MEVITLAMFKEHARIDFDDDDLIAGQVVSAANNYVSGLLCTDVEEPPAPAGDVVQAALLIAGHWYMNRENASDGALVDIPLNAAEILANHRAWSFG